MDRANRTEKLYLQAFREIRQYIVDENLQPGDTLPTEQQLCQKLGVSRNVLREAIKSMEVMGLIEACPGRGTELCEFSYEFLLQNVICFAGRDQSRRLDELVNLQKTLELSYMRQAFQSLSPETVKELRACVNSLQSAEAASLQAFELHHRFHTLLFRELDNRLLHDLLSALDVMQRQYHKAGRLPVLPEADLADAVVRALEEYNYQAFAQAMFSYFSNGIFEKQDVLVYE